jgi:hypothetical protein
MIIIETRRVEPLCRGGALTSKVKGSKQSHPYEGLFVACKGVHREQDSCICSSSRCL